VIETHQHAGDFDKWYALRSAHLGAHSLLAISKAMTQ
jgi:hypothetical protein